MPPWAGFRPRSAGAAGRSCARWETSWPTTRNTAAAPGLRAWLLFAGYLKRLEHWELIAFARIDNLFDHRYVGSVIVNEGNGRYYEPAPGRNWPVGGSAAYRF